MGALCALASPVSAQVTDTAAVVRQIQAGLESGAITPEQIRARLEAEGITVDDVRQRLRAAGYPENLLDRYLAPGAEPSGVPSLTSEQVEEVLRRLAIPPLDPMTDSLFGPDVLAVDSLFLDTLAVPEMMALPVFGMSLFERATSQFTPVSMGPVPANYELGPGDELVLILTGDVQDVYNLPVTREGFVVIPNVGRVSVNGLTLDQLRNSLYTYLGRVYSGVRRGPEATTFFEVSIATLRRNQVFVIGEVGRPGQVEVTSVSTALDALYQAGGPTGNGSFRNIQIRRGERVVANLDIYEYLTRGAATGDIPLNQGDVVFIPVRGRRVEIDGNVIRPGIYEVKGDEGLRSLLDLAGGIEPEADLRRVQIDRILPQDQRQPGVDRSLFDVNVAEFLDSGGEIVSLEPGDKVYVYAVSEERRNTVTVRGNVRAPGVYAYAPGMTLGEIIERAGGLKDDTYLARGQIVRIDPLDLSRRVVPISLSRDGSVPLDEFDEITVYSVAEFRERRYVTILGAVQFPGAYEFHEDMTLRDLVLVAGGLLPSAYVSEAEVARISVLPDSTADLTELIKVPIDSSYVVDRSQGGGDGSSNGGQLSATPEFELEGYDNVFIRSRPGFELPRTVAITGEVRFPGYYSLERKDEGIESLIERAGGLTSEAYAEGVRFFRIEHTIGDPEPHLAQLNVDLPAILAGSSDNRTVIMVEGDSVHVPEYIATIQVDGAVLYPTSVLYDPGQGLDYYVSNAGGYARDADSGRTRVEYANGTVKKVSGWFIFKSKPKPEAGSRVFVPAKPPPTAGGLEFRNLIAVLTAVTTMVIIVARN
jgi:protein involved in polysaccharide export with SLBB domain